MDEGYVFDNILIANDPAAAAAKREALWAPKKEAEVRAAFPPLAVDQLQSVVQCSGPAPGARSGSPFFWPLSTVM